MLEVVPITLDCAKKFVKEHHRHHPPPLSHKYSIGCEQDGVLIGVVMTGRPVARGLDDGRTAEVTRLCTLGADNACSKLYAAARKVAAAMGYKRVFTYTLASENGASLRASGFRLDGVVKGRSWSCESRPREDKHPTEDKQRWVWP